MNERLRRKAICARCFDRPAGCWKAAEFPCARCYRQAEEAAVRDGACPLDKWRRPVFDRPWPAADCPVCRAHDPIDPPATQDQYLAAFAEMIGRRPVAPPKLAGDGIVTLGEGRYWPMVVLSVRLLRETGCTLPVQVWHNGEIGSELDNEPGVTLVDAAAFAADHPARKRTQFQAKTYSIAHSGFRRALFLDADAYCVRDPAPLFAILDSAPFVYWDAGSPSDGRTNKALFAPHIANWIPPVQGGQYLVDCAAFWPELMIARWMDDHANAWGNRNWDEDSWRCTISAIGSAHDCLGPADWRRIAYVCAYGGRDYFVHRCQAKLFPGRPARRYDGLPWESRVFDLYGRLIYRPVRDGSLQAKRELRDKRQQLLAQRGRI